jgi:hypothetical protein
LTQQVKQNRLSSCCCTNIVENQIRIRNKNNFESAAGKRGGGKGREFKILVVNNKTSLAALGSCNQGKEMLMPYYKRRRKKSAPPLTTLAAAAADTFPSLEEPKPA